MSTIKVNSIKNTATNDGGIAIDNSGHVQIDGQQLPSAGPLSNRNLVDNGAMAIAQRGTSESGLTDSPKFVVDRFSYRRVGAWGTNSFTMSQESSGAPGGFTHFLRLTQSGTAAAPPADTDCRFNTRLEGSNIAQAGFGTSAAKDLTLSFYAKGSVAGTYCVALQNNDYSQSYIAEYSLTTGWTRYEITIPARTTGTWLTDANRGFEISWEIAADSDSTSLTGSAGWNTTSARYTSNQSETFASTSGATFDLCGVQLEIGEKATPFEHRSFSEELLRCQRYCYRVQGDGADGRGLGVGLARTTSAIRCVVALPTTMRANGQDLTESGLLAMYRTSGTDVSMTSSQQEAKNAVVLTLSADSGTPFTAGDSVILRLIDNPTAFFQVESEL